MNIFLVLYTVNIIFMNIILWIDFSPKDKGQIIYCNRVLPKNNHPSDKAI